MNAFLALVLLLARPMQIGCALGAFLGLSAYFISSSPTTNSFTCGQEIAAGENLSNLIQRDISINAILIDLQRTSDPEHMLEQEDWKALLYEVDSTVEALRQDCRVEASTK